MLGLIPTRLLIELAAIGIMSALLWVSRAEVGHLHTRLDAATAQHKAEVAAIRQQNATDRRAEQAQRIDNEQAMAQLQVRLDGALARGSDLARRLRDAYDRADPLPGGADQPGPATAGGTPSQGQIDTAVGERFAECERNESRLDALIAELRPQLSPAPASQGVE